MTYAEWYVAGMYELLERGGKLENIDALVAEINEPSNEGLTKYVKTRGFTPCGACGKAYGTSDDADLKLDKEMLCPSCKGKISPS
jgi:hypothetical protein